MGCVSKAKGGFLSGLKRGALHKDLGVPQGDKIPADKLQAAKQKGGLEAKRAQFAINAAKWKK